MCGIAGFVAGGGACDLSSRWDEVSSMLAGMHHRGPDDAQITSHFGRVCVGGVRLSIVDVSGSNQPLRNETGDVALYYNGEIYNYRELRDDLARAGHAFSTRGDGEPILHAYEDDARAFAARLDGMFAFALVDSRRERVVLGRDRLGIKPLYYYTNGSGLWFASELKALMRCVSVPLERDFEAIHEFLSFGFALPPRTFVKDVRQLEPGCLLTFEFGRARVERYWEAGAAPARLDGPDEDGFARRLETAVRTTVNGEADVGVLLSGGLDSSAVAALATLERPPIAFTVGYPDPGGEDEREWARCVAAHLGLEHREVVITPQVLRAELGRAIASLEEPIYSTVSLSTFVVAQLASSEVRVVASGDGADELLLGYDHLRRALPPQSGTEDFRVAYRKQIAVLSGDWARRIAGENLSNRCDPDLIFAELLPEQLPEAEQLRYFEFRYRLPGYQLGRVDRLGMAHALEVRVPFLRNDVVDWTLARSADELLAEPGVKHPLLDACRRRLPRSILARPKQKFSSPMLRWLTGPLLPEIGRLLSPTDGIESLGFSPAGVHDLLSAFRESPETHVRPVWALTLLALWNETFWESLRTVRREAAPVAEPYVAEVAA